MKRDLSARVFAAHARSEFRKLVMRPEFSCLGAKAAFNDHGYGFAAYESMGTGKTAARLGRDLNRFVRSETMTTKEYSSFIAVFRRPLEITECEFENLLWLELRQLHAVDHSDWDPTVSSDPRDPHFSFSFGGQAFYVVGMHARSSRAARRFTWPTLVFNPHLQFERLRTEGRWKRMQQSIRARELALQGNINPMLSEFGEQTEARQYSGRSVSENWDVPFPSESKCPFGH